MIRRFSNNHKYLEIKNNGIIIGEFDHGLFIEGDGIKKVSRNPFCSNKLTIYYREQPYFYSDALYATSFRFYTKREADTAYALIPNLKSKNIDNMSAEELMDRAGNLKYIKDVKLTKSAQDYIKEQMEARKNTKPEKDTRGIFVTIFLIIAIIAAITFFSFAIHAFLYDF